MKFTSITMAIPDIGMPKKILLIMKLTTLLIIINLLQVSATGYGQRITLNERNVPLETVLELIKKQTGNVFIYNNPEVKKAEVSIQVNNASIYETLEKCFKSLPFEFKVIGNNVLIRDKEFIPENITSVNLPSTVTGKVTDSNGSPLPGVNIRLKGTNIGTSTDLNGNYSLDIPNGGILVFSFIGFVSQEVQIQGRTNISIVLAENLQELNEVVAIGYASVRRIDLTGAVSSIGAKDLQDSPINSAAEILNGKLAGVQVTSSEGSPDADVRIRVRGVGSLTQDASPIYIIDGIQIEDGLNMLSPQDIESIDVLKDAASTAIYGARGANGVIIITTKGGKEMKTRVSYNASFGVSTLANKLSVMSPYEFVMFQYEKNPIDPTITDPALFTSFQRNYGSTFDTLSVYKNVTNIDWQDELMGRNAPYQTHNASVSGGSKTTQFNLSITSNDQDAILLTRHMIVRL